MMHVLVVGGAGYIGSHTVAQLIDEGHQVTVLDNLSSGHKDAVLCDNFIMGDLSDVNLLNKIFSEQKIDVVMHFASYIEVGESIINPAKYYINNVQKVLTLLNSVLQHNIKNFIFSSSASVYGEPKYHPIDELHPLHPISPYGRTKLMIEEILADYEKAYGIQSVCLRYFNAAGADIHGRLRERHHPETHLIPIILQKIQENSPISINGNDYPTPDGTCVRDYVHVTDIAQAHINVAQKLMEKSNVSKVYNLGTGNGFSVSEIIQTVTKITGKKANIKIGSRRPGDPAFLIADNRKIIAELGFKFKYSNIETIVKTAWQAIELIG